MQNYAALTSRREQERILRIVCDAQQSLTFAFAENSANGANRDQWPGRFVAFESGALWVHVPRLLESHETLAGRRAEIRFEHGAPLRAVATALGRAPRLGPQGRPELHVHLRRPILIEPSKQSPPFMLTAAQLADVSAMLIDLDDVRLVYSPRPLRITRRAVDLVIDSPERFRGGERFELRLAIPGHSEQPCLYLRRNRLTTDGHGRSKVSFRILAGDEPRWTSHAVAALLAFAERTRQAEPVAAVSSDIRRGGMPC